MKIFETTYVLKRVNVYFVFTFLFQVLHCIVFSQVSTGYNFTTYASSYNAITGGSTLTTGDDLVASVTLPFNFIYNGVQYTTANNINVSTNGFITFGATAPATNNYTPISNTGAYSGAISAMGEDLTTITSPELRWESSGGVLTIQWKNFRRFDPSPDDVLNFQIKLYQTTNKIEIVYGSITINSSGTADDVQVGLRGSSNSDDNNITTTDWSTFSAGSNTATCKLLNTPVKPSSGLTLCWTRNGDNCSAIEAITIDNPSSIAGNLSVCTGSPLANSACGGTDTEDAFYTFTTTTAGIYPITVVGSAAGGYSYPFNPVVALYSSCASASELACAGNNVRPANGTQTISYSCAASTKYYVRVYEYTANLSGVNPTFGIQMGGALPVSMLHVSAKCNQTNVELNWTTSTETNNDYFSLEKSKDAVNFEFFKTISGAGNSNQILNYHTTDNAPFSGISYYRLSQTDYDGKQTTFLPIAVSCKDEFGHTPDIQNINYNSSTKELELLAKTDEETNLKLLITDCTGRNIINRFVTIDAGSSSNKIAVGRLAQGMYFVTLVSKDVNCTKKIVVQY